MTLLGYFFGAAPSDLVNLPVWQKNRTMYQSHMGVERPHIMEISPMQYGLLSKAARVRYDANRDAAWAASTACAKTYEEACAAAYLADPAILNDPKITKDAKDAIYWARTQATKDAEQARIALINKTNRILPTDDVQVGDRVFSLMWNGYGVVEKKTKASFSLRTEDGSLMSTKILACQWLHYDDVKKAAALGLTSAHPRNSGVCAV